MNSETRRLEANGAANKPLNEEQQIIEQNASAPNDKMPVRVTAAEINGVENRFARLKKNLRKRSASIL